jgi:orotate phosphoribosyltransferase
MDLRAVLLAELVKYAYQFRFDERDWFTLASGERSPEYFDCKLALSQCRAMSVMGPLFLELLDKSVCASGGLTMGADPIAMSTCQASFGTNREVRWFVVRKDRKLHGQKKLIEGCVKRGDRVAVVDDVVTSGKSTIQAIEDCREYGLDVAQVIVLVDREQLNGVDNIRKAARSVAGQDVPVLAVFKKSEIVLEWQRQTQESGTSVGMRSMPSVRASVRG